MSTELFGTRAGLVADLNLAVQVILLVAVSFGALQARRGRSDTHEALMTGAVVVNAAAIILVMNPSFFRALPSALRDPGTLRSMLLWPHMVSGALAELLGVYAVIRTRVVPSGPAGWRGAKATMTITWLLWVLAAAVGVGLYVVWYL
jgi:uncharacterized membrane protein YozB (DUF420 family)